MKCPTPWLYTKETSTACKAFMQNSKAGMGDMPLPYKTTHQALSAGHLRVAACCLAAKTLTSPPLHTVASSGSEGGGQICN